MAQRKSVRLSTRPVHHSEAIGSGPSVVSGDFIPAETPVATASRGDPDYGLLAQAVYGTVYALSFSCVLGALLVSRILPGQEILSRGIGDGARAAKRVANGIGTQPREIGERESSPRRAEGTLRTF